MTQTLSQLDNRDSFIERHIGPDAQQQQEMLKTVGADSLNALIGQIVPQDIQLATPPQVGDATTEFAALAELKAIAGRNKRFKSYIGMGLHRRAAAAGHSAQHAGKPGLVYRLYPLPAGSIPGPSGVAAQLPAGHSGSDRVGYRFRFAA